MLKLRFSADDQGIGPEEDREIEVLAYVGLGLASEIRIDGRGAG